MKQKLLNSFRLKATLLVAVLCALFTGQAWATNYISYNGNKQDASTTISNSNVSSGSAGKISWTGTSCSYGNNRVNIAANGSITFTAESGYHITKIVLATGTSPAYYGTWSSTPSVDPSGAGTTDVTFEGLSSNSVTITTTSAYRCTSSGSIKIYYEADAAKEDPTISFNDGSVRVGQDLNLNTLFTSNSAGAVTYSITAGGSYASLDGCTLTGVAEGSVTVKATQAAAGSYNAGEATATITVNPALVLSSIAVTTAPTKTTYYEGETFDPTGIVVTATYSDSSTDDVTASCTYSPSTSTALTTSNTAITVSYTENAVEKTTTQAITVNALPKYTVTFSDGGSETQASYGASVTLPSRSNVGDYTFAGWSITNVASETTSAPAIISAGSYTPTENITLYPVYTRTEGGSSAQNETASVTISDYATANNWVSGTKYSSITLDTNITATGTDNGDNSKYYSTGTNWRFYASTSPAGAVTISTTAGTLSTVTLTYSQGAFTYGGDAISSGSAVAVSGTSAEFTCTTNARITAISVNYTVGGGGTTYYWSTPVIIAVTGVSVDATASVNVGETTALTATVLPNNATNKNVTWESDDETIATVDASGVVTGVAAGSATITATSVADNTKTASCTVTVTTVAVTGVSVDATATVKIGKTVTLTSEITPSNATNKNVTWESSNTAIATVTAEGIVTGVAAGNATITVKSVEDATKSASCTVTVITAGNGTKANPYDVAEALEIISGYSSGSGSAENVYTKGIVSSVGSMYNNTMLTYFISIDGTGENTIQVFRGKNLGNTNFAATSDISVNDEVIVYGQLYKYNSTPEINSGNYLYSLNGVKIPEITFDAASYEVAYNGSLTITATADCSGAITYSSSDETVAEINSTTGVVTPHKTGVVTITANVAASVDNIAGSKEVELTVTDGRESAGIAFAEASVTKTWGEAFTGQDLTNPNSVAVTYESSEPTVATVNASGVVTIVKAGETVITASFAGDSDYMPAEVSYTLTVNKADAGLSFDETEFDVDLNGDSFVAPTLNNPNSLTVTYASNDEDIAIIIDENTGEVFVETSAEGTVTITASFAGNDNYNAGNASYTITITDPDRKGTKKNPYTVAEVNSGSYSGNNYVKGYIVGYFAGKDQNAANSGNTNIALSDSPSEISGENTIAVQLPSGAIRNAWNIDDNDVIGYEVIVYGNITGYFTNKTGVKSTTEISAVSVPVTVGAAGYTTITTEYAVSFEGTDVTAYKATAVNTSTIHLEEVEEAPAGTPLVIKATAGKHTGIAVIASAADIDDNLLLSSDGNMTGGSGIYALSKNGDLVGFNPVSSEVTIPAGKAYLDLSGYPNPVKAFLSFDFSDADGIQAIEKNQESMANGQIFNLAGQRLSKMQKGINIVNGKKVLVK